MTDPALQARIAARLEAVGVEAHAGTLSRLEAWLGLHGKWSRIANLTGTRDAQALLDLHLTDCAAIQPLLPPGRLLDVGSGSGLPGLVLAAMDPERPMVLLDSAGKRTRFLEQAAMELGLEQVSVVTARCEAWWPDADAPIAGIVARALAPLPRLVAWTGHLLAMGIPLLAMKGPAWAEEARALPSRVRLVEVRPYEVPGTGREHVLVRIEHHGDDEGRAERMTDT